MTNLKTLHKEFEEIFGEKHHEICEGKSCVCHKETKAFINKAYKAGRENGIKDMKDYQRA
jgi:L-2-hydroxyglutarate oxidase LhgO